MELLNISPVAILPQTMWVAYRALQATPGLTQDELENAVCPQTLKDEAPSSGAHVQRAVDALLKFGLVHVDGEAVSGGWMPSEAADASLRSFTHTLRGCVLGSASTEEELPQDLNRAVVWLLSQSPLDAYDYIRADKELADLFTNGTRWNTFRHWATFLGLGRELPIEEGGLSVDPTPAVMDAIEKPKLSDLAIGTSIEMRQLVRHVQTEIPVFAQIATSSVDTIPASLAYAFWALHGRGKIKLENRSDSRSVVRFPAGSGSLDDALFSHVTIEVGN